MQFLLALLLTYVLTIPGIYLVSRSRLASSKAELLASGFFCGFGLLVVTYIALGQLAGVAVIDALVAVAVACTSFFLISDLRKQQLPAWISPARPEQLFVIAITLVFMIVLTYGGLSRELDDDLFIHLPNIQRIAMGDVPPHVPYFPDTYLRGHTGRDIFIGTVARMLSLRPELSIIYVTLAVCPAYILMFYALASRLASAGRLATPFAFFGVLFLVSGGVGNSEIRSGAITYILNNNAVAMSHAAFIAWLIARLCQTFAPELPGSWNRWWQAIYERRLAVSICVLSYAALYFIYLSNFLMFSVFLPPLLLLLAAASRHRFINVLLKAASLAALVVAGMVLVQLLLSPFLLERVLISLRLFHPSEQMGLVQQAQLTFPKEALFSITDRSGQDIPFFTIACLSNQGLSFYIGLSGLIYGLLTRTTALAATSLFGWTVMLWLLLVDMGEFRAETLRLLLVGHMALGMSTGLVVASFVSLVFGWIRAAAARLPALNDCAFGWGRWRLPLPAVLKVAAHCAVLALAVGALFWMGRGSFEKVLHNGYMDVHSNMRLMKQLHRKDPQNWQALLNMPSIDADTFTVLKKLVRGPGDRLLLRLSQDDAFLGAGHPVNKIAQMVNAAAVTGAGIAGVSIEDRPPQMDVVYLPFGYRSSLFWQDPTPALLEQLAPDWLVVDPSLLSPGILERVLSLPGIRPVTCLEDESNRKRLILQWRKNDRVVAAPATGIRAINPLVGSLETSAFSLARLPVTLELATAGHVQPAATAAAHATADAGSWRLGMLVYNCRNKPVNLLDMPLVPLVKTGNNLYELHFSMVQPGSWSVCFVHPDTRKPLHPSPISVRVRDSAALCQR